MTANNRASGATRYNNFMRAIWMRPTYGNPRRLLPHENAGAAGGSSASKRPNNPDEQGGGGGQRPGDSPGREIPEGNFYPHFMRLLDDNDVGHAANDDQAAAKAVGQRQNVRRGRRGEDHHL